MSDRIAVLRDGQLVQVGTPEDLYERPASTYVARFLGESNIFSGTSDGELFVDRDTKAAFTVGSTLAGATALVVRPEHLQLSSAARGDVPTGHNGLSGVVRDVVYLGSGLRVEVALPDGRTVVARAPTRTELTPRPGLPVIAHWHPERSLVVLADTGDDADDGPDAGPAAA